MEKAILKTLIYADVFDYPLRVWEVHKWLIGKQAILRQVEKVLNKLVQSEKCKVKSGYYFLHGRSGIVKRRQLREKQSGKFLRKARGCVWFLKIIPWIKMVGISGGLAMGNSSKADDIDLFIITARDRLWLSRLLILGMLSLIGQRRMVSHTRKEAAGKICPNILIDEEHLRQERQDIYTAHEVLQMRVLWERDGVYSKYLLGNEWAFRFLPNWVGDRIKNNELRTKHKKHNSSFLLLYSIFDIFENLVKKFQMWCMKSPQGMERIKDGALYFHPNDMRPQVLDIYKQKVKSLSTS
ncbi:MAG: hypothetical protein Q8P92_05890 [Candidatus Daviesbacteria bacterium]|nr:hypothetical protein [Candidatus Daviesbacteria bacterium]